MFRLLAFSGNAHGVVEPWSEAVLEIGAAMLFLWWGLLFALGRAPVRWNRLIWPIAAFWLLAALQYGTGTTAVSFLTKIEILKLSALTLLFFLVVQGFETLGHWRGFAWFLLALGFAVSVLGILQHFTFNGKLYWFRELRYGGIPFGPYVNRNHFAGLVELIVPTGLSVLLLRAEDRDRMSLLMVLTLIPIGALFLSASRGGIAAFFLEVGSADNSGDSARAVAAIRIIAGAVVVLFLRGALWFGLALTGLSADLRVIRSWKSARRGAPRCSKTPGEFSSTIRVAGTGLGTLEDVFPRYETLYDGTIVTHTHNDYVEASLRKLAQSEVSSAPVFSCCLLWQRHGVHRGGHESARSGASYRRIFWLLCVAGPQPRRFQSAYPLECFLVPQFNQLSPPRPYLRRMVYRSQAGREYERKIAYEAYSSDGIIPDAWGTFS